MHKYIFLCMLCIVLFCAGCAGPSAGSHVLKDVSQADIATQIEEGETTKAQVETLFGRPDHVTYSEEKNEIWVYQYITSKQHATNYVPLVKLFYAGADVRAKGLMILFDAKNVVQKVTLREANEVKRFGLLNKD